MISIVVPIAMVLMIAMLGAMALGTRRSKRLHKGFGPEYDRTVERHSDPRPQGGSAGAPQSTARLDIRPLEPQARDAYAERWAQAQRRTRRSPDAVAEADESVGEVMRERGYPVDDFGERPADLSVDHQKTVERCREAHAISMASAARHADTEDLRSAMVHYRALFDGLLDDARHLEETTDGDRTRAGHEHARPRQRRGRGSRPDDGRDGDAVGTDDIGGVDAGAGPAPRARSRRR